MFLLSFKANIIVVICVFVLLIGTSTELDFLSSLTFEYSVVDKKEYTFFPELGNDLTIPCEISDSYQQLPGWYKVILMRI